MDVKDLIIIALIVTVAVVILSKTNNDTSDKYRGRYWKRPHWMYPGLNRWSHGVLPLLNRRRHHGNDESKA